MANPSKQLSFFVDHLYRKYAPLGALHGLQLDLDLTRPNRPVENYRTLEEALEAYLSFSTDTPHAGHLLIQDSPTHLIIKDDKMVLNAEQKQKFTSDTISVKSRVGFGTTLMIALQ